MAIVNRISRLFKADIHAVLDQIEEPEQLLKQAIRDMEDDLAKTEQRVAMSAHDQSAITVRMDELQNTIAKIDEQLDLCFESDNDALARSQIRKRLEAERLLKRLSAKHAATRTYCEDQQSLLDTNQATLESLRQKSELFALRKPPHADQDSDFDDVAWMARDMSVDEDEVEIAFLQEKNARQVS